MSDYTVEIADIRPLIEVVDSNTIVEVLDNNSLVVEVGLQGPPGVNGADGQGTYIGATSPTTPTEGMIWYDTVAKQLKVYRTTIWEPLPYNEELNGTFGSVTLNAGYF